ncbi:hypothetical protein NU10_09235 [Flavobacterium dauae]|uniref:hypothetical protein n=1 Tax=Flavobacterium dauae TaxID=1563479 RepID=UPI00101B28FD|nr:hypothetical protein [Flavobacterium dauae]WLD22902.1 hypothetical protein NU10_09235 [Flavobacterium dauae]
MKTILYIILALLIGFAVIYLVDPFFSDTLSILIATIVITIFAGFCRKFEKRGIK